MKTNKNFLKLEEFITKLELSAEKINIIIKDISTEYFDILSESVKDYTFKRTSIKVDIISDYLDKFLLDLKEFDDFYEHIYK